MGGVFTIIRWISKPAYKIIETTDMNKISCNINLNENKQTILNNFVKALEACEPNKIIYLTSENFRYLFNWVATSKLLKGTSFVKNMGKNFVSLISSKM